VERRLAAAEETTTRLEEATERLAEEVGELLQRAKKRQRSGA
jgi:NTP pyrophosphatase (non-canonical NTP hydrolase)